MSAHHPAGWLTKLRATQLHRLAVSIGTPCSGTKTAQIEGIRKALSSLQHDGNHAARTGKDALSLLSIDMGIRNLAFSHWRASRDTSASQEILQYSRPILNAWQKIDISSSSMARRDISHLADPCGEVILDAETAGVDNKKKKISTVKETFEPIDYADRAYTLVKHLLDTYKPSHILIERQRFRSGGNAAVQEWTIRVGVFEGMLYAALRGFADVHHHNDYDFSVEPMLPARVNRYWFRDEPASSGDQKELSTSSKMTARDVKKAKIDLTSKLLGAATERSEDTLFETHENDTAAATVQRFLDRTRGTDKQGGAAKRNRSQVAGGTAHVVTDMSKLDDLADCLLQGLAWTRWQNNRLKLQALQQDASDLYT